MKLTGFAVSTCVLVLVNGHEMFLVNRLAAQESENKAALHQKVVLALTNYHKSQFREAEEQALALCDEYPDNPAGYFCLLTTYQTIMRNYRVRVYEAKYDSLLDLSIDVAKKAIKKDKKDGVNYFYLGCLYGSRSIFHAQRRKWLAAFKDGSKVLNQFNKALHYRPDFYDSHYGIGLYKYWLGAKMKLLRVLPFARDDRHEGLSKMKLAMEKGEVLHINAKHALVTANFNEGNYAEAKGYNDQLYENYRSNPTVLYRRGNIYRELGQWENAVTAFEELMDLLETTEYQSISYQVECLFRMAQGHFELGNYLEAQRLCREAIEREAICDFSKEIEGPLEKHSEVKKMIRDLQDQVGSILLAHAKNTAAQ
ncbi:tetratricopeptide repeat protein [bacterium]|nr:tetratricopeptide repeat protein [bacterium]